MDPTCPERLNTVEFVGKQTLAEPANVPPTVVGDTVNVTTSDAIDVEQDGVEELGSTIQ